MDSFMAAQWRYLSLVLRNYRDRSDPPSTVKWVMSPEWFIELLAVTCGCGQPVWTPGQNGYSDTLFGLPYEIRPDEKLPRLVEAA